MNDAYIPGVCNIGPAEIRKRNTVAWVGLGATIVLWIFFVMADTRPLFRLFIGIPAMMSAMGFIQARLHFCAYFGLAALFNFDDVGKTDSVSQAAFCAQDRKKAWQIIVSAVAIGVGVALIAYTSA